MNLVLHHFHKEFAYLRLRWFGFWVLLGFDLAVNLEWLFPLRAGVQPPAWLVYLPWVLMLVAVTLLGSCPEDKPGSDRSFISTRPLPTRAYWLTRVALWLLLLVLPVLLQNALYLRLSGRPAMEMLAGTWERGLWVIQYTAWMLPMTALWRRGEFWAALGLLAAGWLIAGRLVDFIALSVSNTILSADQSVKGATMGMLMFAAGILWMAWRHQWSRVATFRRRLLIMFGIGLTCFLSARFWPWHEQDEPFDQARVRELATKFKAELDLTSYGFNGFEEEMYRQMFGQVRAETGDASVSVLLRPQRARITQEGHDQISVPNLYHRTRRNNFRLPLETVMNTDQVLRDLFPAGTIFTTTNERSMWGMYSDDNTHLAEFQPPYPNPEKPLRVTTECEIDWYQRDLELNIPLKVGSTGQSESHAWRVMQVHENQNETGTPSLGQVNVELHVQTRGVEIGLPSDNTVLLYSPQRRLVWLEPAFQTGSAPRAGASGWSRHSVRLGWRKLLNYADGEDAGVDVSQLRLIMLRSRFLGSSEWTWKSPDIVLRDHPSQMSAPTIHNQNIYIGREIKAFQDRLATLKAPTANTPEPEVRRYLYDLLATVSTTDVAHKTAALKEVSDAFRPLMQHHLPLMLELPSSLWPGWNNQPPKKLLDEYLTEAQREMAIDLVMTNSVLTNTLIRKGWTESARRLQPRLLSLPKLPHGADELLLKWADEASHEKLMQEQRSFAQEDTFEQLNLVPALRPRLEKLSREIIQSQTPLLKDQGWWVAERFQIAADFGDRDALDVCLRWMALAGDVPSPSCSTPFPNLLKADGSKLWQQKVDREKQWPRYRHLKVSDFDYLPELRAWKLRQP